MAARGAIPDGSGGRDGGTRWRLSGKAEHGEEPAHGMGLRHGPEDPPRAAAARTHEDLNREHPVEEPRPGPPGR